MPRERAFVLVLLTFVTTGIVAGTLRNRTERRHHTFAADLPAPRPQDVPSRRIRELDFTTSRPAGDSGPGALVRGTASRIGADGDLFVLDWRDAAIKRFAQDGTFHGTYRFTPDGASAGGARPSDFALGPDGELWVAYGHEMAVGVFADAGEPRAVYNLDVRPARLAVASDGRFAVLSLGSGEMFRVYGQDGALERRFGKLLDDLQEPILLDGSLAADPAGGFVYAPFFLGVLAGFGFDGELRFLVGTIDGLGVELPVLEVSPDGHRQMAPGTPWRSIAVSVVGERLHVLAERESKLAGGRLLDVYRAADGTYLESIRLPDVAQSAHLWEGHLTTVRDGLVRIWE